MTDGKVNGEPVPAVDAATAMAAEISMITRKIEAHFPGTNVTVFISAPGAARGSPEFNWTTTAQPDDLRAVIKSFQIEKGWHRG